MSNTIGDVQLTTSGGNAIADNQNSLSAGPRGPLLMQDYQLIEKLAHQNLERIPERTVHAKGSGAYGTLTITHDITKYSKAAYYEPNSFNGPRQDARFAEPPLKISGEAGRFDHRAGNDDYSQPGALFRLMTAEQQARLFRNIAATMTGVPGEIIERQLAHFHNADPRYAEGVRKALFAKDEPRAEKPRFDLIPV
jgi:catalase